MLEETTFISQFDVKPDGSINVRKTTQVKKNGAIIAESYWRCALAKNDPNAAEVLDEPFYFDLAVSAWNSL